MKLRCVVETQDPLIGTIYRGYIFKGGAGSSIFDVICPALGHIGYVSKRNVRELYHAGKLEIVHPWYVRLLNWVRGSNHHPARPDPR